MRFPISRQPDIMDCGVACLQMVSKYYGVCFPLQHLRDKTQIGKEGVSLLGISQAAESIDFRTRAVQLDLEQLKSEARLPCILHWDQEHFVVLYKVVKDQLYVADPARGRIPFSDSEFREHWAPGPAALPVEGIALFLEPTRAFYERGGKDQGEGRLSFASIFKYLTPHRRLIVNLLAGLLIGSLLQLSFPFITRSIVDVGIRHSNLRWIYLILAGQMVLVIGRLTIDFIRSWILLHISMKITISILSDFLIKLMKLPVSFFDSKMTGDILQRMNDHQRIETFLTGSSVNVLFSMVTFLVYSVALAMFNPMILFVFGIFSLIYSGWVIVFFRVRRRLDQKRFLIASQEQAVTIQLIQGMQEIKLHGIEGMMRRRWQGLQGKLFRLNMQGLTVNQWQQAGASFLNEGKSLFITFLTAKAVIEGDLSLGALLSIQYMIGGLSSPIDQIIGFMQGWQNAKMSMERLNEIHDIKDEEPAGLSLLPELPPATLPLISISDMSFTYAGAGNEPVLKDICLDIPKGKTTAIVGMSGSGKTTLVKLLLKIYEPQKGTICVHSTSLSQISHKAWRRHCGVVMQESHIFSDTICNNIILSEEEPDMERLLQALEVANIRSFIESLPMGLHTKIGAEGTGISMGQRQRILIARAVYRDPEFIFFDEATNSLDATNESIIHGHLEKFFSGRTVMVVAHRLSTVRNADQIVVLNKGRISERGTHRELIDRKGEYYSLVSNQLELDQ